MTRCGTRPGPSSVSPATRDTEKFRTLRSRGTGCPTTRSSRSGCSRRPTRSRPTPSRCSHPRSAGHSASRSRRSAATLALQPLGDRHRAAAGGCARRRTGRGGRLLCIVTGFVWSAHHALHRFRHVAARPARRARARRADHRQCRGAAPAAGHGQLPPARHASARCRPTTPSAPSGWSLAPLLVALLAGRARLHLARRVPRAWASRRSSSRCLAIGLRDPGFGKWDTEQLRASVHEAHGEATTSCQRRRRRARLLRDLPPAAC